MKPCGIEEAKVVALNDFKNLGKKYLINQEPYTKGSSLYFNKSNQTNIHSVIELMNTEFTNKYGVDNIVSGPYFSSANRESISLNTTPVVLKQIKDVINKERNTELEQSLIEAHKLAKEGFEKCISDSNYVVIDGEIYNPYDSTYIKTLDSFVAKMIDDASSLNENYNRADRLKDFKFTDSTTIGDVIAHLTEDSQLEKNPYFSLVAAMANYWCNPNTPVKISNLSGARGMYSFSSQKGELLQLDAKSGINERVFLHELIHASTSIALHVQEKYLTKEQRKAKAELIEIYNQVMNERPELSDYGLTNIDEFIAEFMSNDAFRDKLANMKLNKKYTIKYKVVALIAKLLGYFYVNPVTDNMVTVVFDRIISLSRDSNATRKEIGFDTIDISRNLINNDEWSIPIVDGKQADYYESISGEKRKRVTSSTNGLTTIMANKTNTLDYLIERNYTQDEIDNNIQKTTTKFPNKKLSYTEFIQAYENQSKVDALQGSIRELYIQKDSLKTTEFDSRIQQLTNELQSLLPDSVIDFSWLTREKPPMDGETFALDRIYSLIGHNVSTSATKPLVTDLQFGIKVGSKALGYMGTIDMGVKHHDDSLTFVEMKTGNNFLREKTSVALYKHGIREGISTSNLNNAQLQLMWYMFLAKIQNPNLKIRRGIVLYANSEKQVFSSDAKFDLEVEDFTQLIQNFLLDTDFLEKNGLPKNAYDLLEQEYMDNGGKSFKDLFQGYTYFNDSPEVNILTTNTEELFNKAEREILTASKGLPIASEGNETIYSTTKQKLADAGLIVLRRFSNTTLDFENPNAAYSALYQMNDWDSNTIQAFTMYAEKNKLAFTNELKERLNVIEGFRERAYGKKFIGLNLSNKTKYSHLYTDHVVMDSDGKELRREKRLLTPNETDPANKAKWNALTKQEQEYIDYFNRRIKYYYHPETGLFAQKNIYDPIKAKTNISDIDLYNATTRGNDPFVYYEGWIPKVRNSSDLETAQNFGEINLDNTLKKKIDNIKKQILKKEVNTAENFQPLPLENMGNPYALNNAPEVYSVDPFYILSKLENDNLYKKNMEKVFHVGRALSFGFSENKHVNRYGLSKHTSQGVADWLDDYLKVNVLKLKSETKFSKPIHVSIDKNKGTDKEYTTAAQLNISGAVNGLVSYSANTIMSLRVFNVLGNLTSSQVINFRGRIANAILKQLGTDESYLDYTDGYFKSNSHTMGYVKDAMLNNLSNNILHDLAVKNNIPVSFDVSEKMDTLIKSKQASASGIWNKMKYGLLNFSENINSLHLFSSYLHNIKGPNGKPILEFYGMFEIDENGNAVNSEYNKTLLNDKRTALGSEFIEMELIDGIAVAKASKYCGTTRFKQRISSGEVKSYVDVKGLTTEEIAKAKAIYDRKHGEYRDKLAMEVNGFATLFTMLHRFFPRILKNMFEQRKQISSMGRYETVFDSDLNEEIKVWTDGVVEGRARLVFNMLMILLRDNRVQNYKLYWKSLDIEQRKIVIESMVALCEFAALYGIYVLLFADSDDDDTAKKWFERYAMNNPLQEVNPSALLENAKNVLVPAPLDVMNRFWSGSTQVMMASYNYAIGDEEDAFTQRGDLRGWNNFKKTIPIASWAFDFKDKIDKLDLDEEN